MGRAKAGLAALLAAGSLSMSQAGLIKPMEHDIFAVTAANFNSVIGSHRNDQVACMLFYNNGDASKALINGEYNKLAKSLKGQIKVTALSCPENGAFCRDNKIEEFPKIMVYPANPQPPFIYEKDLKDLAKTLMNLIPSKVLTLTAGKAFDEFLADNLAVPKVVLFSDKKSPPPMFKALSNSFKDRLSFGFVAKTSEDLIKRQSVSKYPTIRLFKAQEKPLDYPDPVNAFQPIHDWLNVRSETFVKGGGFSDEGRAEDSRIWLVQKVPELTRQSHQDICFKKHGDMCVVYLVEGEATDEDIKMLEEHRTAASSHGDRGVNYRWMWLDTKRAPEWKTILGVETFPTVIVVNPKKLRWTALDEFKSDIAVLLDKIGGGDARFKPLKGGKIPALPSAQRDEL